MSPEVSSPEQPIQEHLRSTYCRSLWGLMYLHHVTFGQFLLQPLCFNTSLSGRTLRRMVQVYPKSNFSFQFLFPVGKCTLSTNLCLISEGRRWARAEAQKMPVRQLLWGIPGQEIFTLQGRLNSLLETNLPFNTTYSSQPDQETEQIKR